MKNLIRQTFAKLVLRLASALLRRAVKQQTARAAQRSSHQTHNAGSGGNGLVIDGEYRRISDH